MGVSPAADKIRRPSLSCPAFNGIIRVEKTDAGSEIFPHQVVLMLSFTWMVTRPRERVNTAFNCWFHFQINFKFPTSSKFRSACNWLSIKRWRVYFDPICFLNGKLPDWYQHVGVNVVLHFTFSLFRSLQGICCGNRLNQLDMLQQLNFTRVSKPREDVELKLNVPIFHWSPMCVGSE